MITYREMWQKHVYDFSDKLKKLDNPALSNTEMEEALNQAVKSAEGLTEFGYLLAKIVDEKRDDYSSEIDGAKHLKNIADRDRKR